MNDPKIMMIVSTLSFLTAGCVGAFNHVDAGAVVLVGVICIILVLFIKEQIRRAIQGYYVYMRGGVQDGDARYNESGKEIRFYFTRKDRTIYIPTSTKWNEIMPEWAKPKRDEIVARLRKRISKTWKFKEADQQEHLRSQG